MRIIRPITITDNAGSFTRATTKTYIDANGMMQTAAIDEPCWDYSGGTFKGLLLEAAGTNLLAHSETFDDAYWTKSATTITANAVAGPDGEITADKLCDTADNAVHYVGKSVTVNELTPYVFSCFAESAEISKITMYVMDATGWPYTAFAIFDLSAGTVAYQACTASIIALPDGRYRCILKAPPSASGANNATLLIFTNEGNSYVGDGSGVYIWGAQFEVGTEATSYIPTTAAPVTRSADVMTASLLTDVPENDYTAWNSGTNYVAGDYCMKSHKIFLCGANNSNSDPELAINQTGTPPKWIYKSYNNRWKMFDQVNGSQTAQAEFMTYTLVLDQLDSISFLAAEGTIIEAAMATVANGVVFTETIDLINDRVTGNWYQYFFEPLVASDRATLLGIPPYLNPILSFRISNPGSTAKLGTFVAGMQYYVGGAQYEAAVELEDFSLISRNDYGEYVLEQGNFADSMDIVLELDKAQVSDVKKTMTALRARPLVFIGTEEDTDYEWLTMLGIYQGLRFIAKGPEQSIVNFSVRGLI